MQIYIQGKQTISSIKYQAFTDQPNLKFKQFSTFNQCYILPHFWKLNYNFYNFFIEDGCRGDHVIPQQQC